MTVNSTLFLLKIVIYYSTFLPFCIHPAFHHQGAQDSNSPLQLLLPPAVIHLGPVELIALGEHKAFQVPVLSPLL